VVAPDSSLALARTQRAAVETLKDHLYGRDPVSLSRYVRDFHDEFRDFRRVSSYDDLVVACFQADVVLVGEYHALPDHQRFAARLLESLARRSTCTLLALEMIYARHQPALDAWMQGRADDRELRARIRYDLEWGYDWEGPEGLLDMARRLGVRTYGVDGPARGGLKTLRRRDTLAAERLAGICTEHPGAHLMVVFGESHLSREHLPHRLHTALRTRGLERRVVRVVQDVDEIYWRLLDLGLEHRDVVEVSHDTYAVFGGSPIRKYEAYRRTLERWNAEEEDDELDLTPTVHAMIDTILRYLKVDPARKKAYRGGPRLLDVYPEVYGRQDLPLVGRVLEGAGVDRAERAAILRRVRREGSCYVPQANLVLLGSHRLTDAGEEAAHFVHQALSSRTGMPRGEGRRSDLFYREVMEEALGYFGSKLIDPSRNLFFEEPLYRDRRKRNADRPAKDEDRILDFVLLHRRLERGRDAGKGVPREILRTIEKEVRLCSTFAHHLGYFLGSRLFEAHRAVRLGLPEVRDLFRQSFSGPGAAIQAYFSLVPMLEGE
jgi:uncharacterized iron-regulated protein